jgi:hypothetical protein
MVSTLLRLVTAIALMLMPLGMAQAAAVGAPASAAVEAGHCDEHSEPGKAPAGPNHHCAACTAIPSLESPSTPNAIAPKAPLTAESVAPLPGLELEIATPPPRQG